MHIHTCTLAYRCLDRRDLHKAMYICTYVDLHKAMYVCAYVDLHMAPCTYVKLKKHMQQTSIFLFTVAKITFHSCMCITHVRAVAYTYTDVTDCHHRGICVCEIEKCAAEMLILLWILHLTCSKTTFQLSMYMKCMYMKCMYMKFICTLTHTCLYS